MSVKMDDEKIHFDSASLQEGSVILIQKTFASGTPGNMRKFPKKLSEAPVDLQQLIMDTVGVMHGSNGIQTQATKVCLDSVEKNCITDSYADTETPKKSNSSLNAQESSDSGVDISKTPHAVPQSTKNGNSGCYNSSTIVKNDETTQGLFTSCDSSIISCISDKCQPKVDVPEERLDIIVPPLYYEYSDSESSNPPTAQRIRHPRPKNTKVNEVTIPATQKKQKENDVRPESPTMVGNIPIRQRNSTLRRAASLNRPNSMQSRERSTPTTTPSLRKAIPISTRILAQPLRTSVKPQKPDSLPNSLSRSQLNSAQNMLQRTPSQSRARTPCTPSDDGRVPNVSRSSLSSRRGVSMMPDITSVKSRTNAITSVDTKLNNCNPYGTLPRRRKPKSVENLTEVYSSRSNSIARDARMTASVIVPSRSTPTTSQRKNSTVSVSSSRCSGLGRKLLSTISTNCIEVGTQTSLTGADLKDGIIKNTLEKVAYVAVEPGRTTPTQCDQIMQKHDMEVDVLRDKLRAALTREEELLLRLNHETDEKNKLQQASNITMERVANLLELAFVTNGVVVGLGDMKAQNYTSQDYFIQLETQIQMSGNELLNRQQEITQLRKFCRSLQVEIERLGSVEDALKQEKVAIERESSELQDFLQNEKTALCDAFKDLEIEHQIQKKQLLNRDEEVKILRDECRHLVRLNEQRRQEYRLLETRYSALESKSKDLMLQQSYTFSGASSALSGLHARLDSLVEQLIFSYSISEHDLEEVPQANGCSESFTEPRNIEKIDDGTKNNSPANSDTTANSNVAPVLGHEMMSLALRKYQAINGSDSLSPQRNQSFIAAVISAIRNATTISNRKSQQTRNGGNSVNNKRTNENMILQQSSVTNFPGQNANNDHSNNMQHFNGGTDYESDVTEMLDSETEPCLMMDNVLEDVTMPDSHSHNMVSSCTGLMISQFDVPSELVNGTTSEESLQNLSQAIVNCQQMELELENNVKAMQKHASQNGNDEQCNSSYHDSIAEISSLVEYSATQAIVDQVIELDTLVTKLLKVLRLIQMDNDNCIQQLIVDKNKLQQTKEELLEKVKDVEVINDKLHDDLMDATQELMLKNNDLSNAKSEIQRHRNEIDKAQSAAQNQSNHNNNNERLRIYANQLENVLRVLATCDSNLELQYPLLKDLRTDIESVKEIANWTNIVLEDNGNEQQQRAMDEADGTASTNADVNAN